jgi:DNA modification methylase
MEGVTILAGDCREVMKTLPDASVDSIVTDPPAGINFMSKSWDRDKGGRDHWIAWMQEIASEALRVIKPGGHALVWALPRTSHWTATAWENAGWTVRERIAHVFGSGFPKNKNALKPAMEDWWLLRRPLQGTVSANVMKWSTGAINIDQCRIATAEKWGASGSLTGGDSLGRYGDGLNNSGRSESNALGRWPANLIHDGSDEVLACFPETPPANRAPRQRSDVTGVFEGGLSGGQPAIIHNDSGSAARYFASFPMEPEGQRLRYVAKASKKDRDAGLEGMPLLVADPYAGHRGRRMPDGSDRFDGKPASKGRNTHPTVKPTELMRYLCRLITPSGGVVLDPFMGSGSTGRGALLEGFRFIGIEREAEYLEIARRRIADAIAPSRPEPVPTPIVIPAPVVIPPPLPVPAKRRQLSLFG